MNAPKWKRLPGDGPVRWHAEVTLDGLFAWVTIRDGQCYAQPGECDNHGAPAAEVAAQVSVTTGTGVSMQLVRGSAVVHLDPAAEPAGEMEGHAARVTQTAIEQSRLLLAQVVERAAKIGIRAGGAGA